MNANELMVGDVVLHENEPYFVRELGIFGADRDGNDYPAVCIGKKNGIGLIVERNEIKPIPLTPEILEKNGFSGKMYAICEIDENRKLQFYYHEHRLKLYWVGVDEYNNSSVVTDEIFRCHCMYVHELQHALKLCHIEKTIEL